MGQREEELLRQFQEDAGVFTYDKERHEFVVTTWLTTLDKMAASLAEKFGWDAVNDQLKVFWAKRAKERIPLGIAKVISQGLPKDCVTLGKVIVSSKIGFGDYEFLEITPKRLHLKIHNCGESIVLRETGLMGKLYWPCTTLWAQAVAIELNPKIQLTVLKAECEGDDYCELLFELNE